MNKLDFKQLYREHRLHKLGIEMTPESKDIFDFLQENFTDLNCYTARYGECIYYGKSEDDVILEYNPINKYLGVCDVIFISLKLSKTKDIQKLISWYVSSTLKIKVNSNICLPSKVALRFHGSVRGTQLDGL